MNIGIKRVLLLAADLVITNSNVLANSTIQFVVGAGQRIYGNFAGIIQVGATGGVQMQMTPNVALAQYQASLQIFNTATNNVARNAITAAAPLGSALANAGLHYVAGHFFFQGAAADSTVTLQFAQNTADPLSLTVLQGLALELTIQ